MKNQPRLHRMFDQLCSDPLFRSYVEQVEREWGRLEESEKPQVVRGYMLKVDPGVTSHKLMELAFGDAGEAVFA